MLSMLSLIFLMVFQSYGHVTVALSIDNNFTYDFYEDMALFYLIHFIDAIDIGRSIQSVRENATS